MMALLLAATVAGGAVFGASSVRTWMDQNAERAEAQAEAAELQRQISELEEEIVRRTSDEALRREALCFGPFVEPGTEVYSVPGLRGCVSTP